MFPRFARSRTVFTGATDAWSVVLLIACQLSSPWQLAVAEDVVAEDARPEDAAGTVTIPAGVPLVRVEFRMGEDQQAVDGRIVIEAQDGGLIVEDRAGRYWSIGAQKLLTRAALPGEFTPFSAGELTTELERELGDGFATFTTEHYVICSNAGRPYSAWCGRLLERLHPAFFKFWEGTSLKLHSPASPLPVLVFRERTAFQAYAQADVGNAALVEHGYYSARTNRVALLDLTSDDRNRPATEDDVARIVSRSGMNVATIVHEATHQLAYNAGLHVRYADNPMWLTEGLAMYFETPDLKNRTGWKTVGQLHSARLKQFREALTDRPDQQSLSSLIASEDRFRDPQRLGDAYAESWAFTHFLVKTRRVDYEAYLRRLAPRPPLKFLSPQERIADIEAACGEDLAAIEKKFLQYIRRIGR